VGRARFTPILAVTAPGIVGTLLVLRHYGAARSALTPRRRISRRWTGTRWGFDAMKVTAFATATFAIVVAGVIAFQTALGERRAAGA